MRIIFALLMLFAFVGCASKSMISANDPACHQKREIMWKRYNGPMKNNPPDGC